jgi:hypothetical protein
LVRFTSGLAGVGLILLGVAFAPVGARTAFAQPAPTSPAEPEAAYVPDDDGELTVSRIAVHGFVSQGAFLSTANDYLGNSERGSAEFLEAAVNVTSGVTDRLRVGAQLFTQDVGPIGNYALVLDWAYLDYRWRDWLGLRAGRIKMPQGLHNEYVDIDAARVPILLPQSVYPITNREFQLAQTGASLYGTYGLGSGGLDYQVFAGAMFIDPQTSSLTIIGPVELDSVDTRYVAGGQVLWRTPLAGLRLGGSYLHTNLEFRFHTDQFTAAQLIMAGLVPDDFNGNFELEWRDINLTVASVEYSPGDWSLSAEYSRWIFREHTSIPDAITVRDQDSERFYGMATYRLSNWLEAGGYYSVLFVDADDRDGSGERFTESHRAYQKDLSVTARFDVNDFWLWKLEAHYMDGTAGILLDEDPLDPDNLARHWGFFLVKTTVSF